MMPNIGRDDAGGVVNGQPGQGRQQRQRNTGVSHRRNHGDLEASRTLMSTTNPAAAMRKEIRKLKEDNKRLCKQFEEWERRGNKGLAGRGAPQLSLLEEGGPGVKGQHNLQGRSEIGVDTVKGGDRGRARFWDYKPTREVKSEEHTERKSVRDPDEEFCFEMVFDFKGLGKRKRDDSIADDCDGEIPEIKKVAVSFESSMECKIVLSGERSKKRSLLGGK